MAKASQKNTTITVTGLKDSDGNTGLTAIVSRTGPDKGKIISVKNNQGKFLDYSSAKEISLIDDNKNIIQNQLDAFAIVGAPTSLADQSGGLGNADPVQLDGIIDKEPYDQEITGKTETGVVLNTVDQTPAAQRVGNQGGSNTSGRVFVLPVDMQINGDGSQDHIRIRALKYKPPQGNNQAFANIVKGGVQSQNANLPPQGYEYEGEVILPIPSAVRDRASASWAMSSMSPITAAAVGVVAGPAIDAVGGDIGALGTGLTRLLQGIPDIFSKESEEFKQVAAASLSASLIKSIGIGGNLEPSDLIARKTGKAANPNMELLFRGPNMRAFDLGWKFVSRSPEEAKVLRQIIKFLKVQSLPNISENANLINSPNVFFIRYMNGNSRIKSLPQPKICALTDFGIDHTPDSLGWSAYEDSHPVATAITMQFLELTPLFRNELEAGFPEDDDVGF